MEFTCDPGHSLEQGPAVIECVNVRDPYWNDTEPLCRGESPPPTAPECQGLYLPAKNKVPAYKVCLNYPLVLGGDLLQTYDPLDMIAAGSCGESQNGPF